MNTYIITASLDGETDTDICFANNDGDAMFNATSIIMNRAFSGENANLWAKGHIVLTHEGRIINEMGAKQ